MKPLWTTAALALLTSLVWVRQPSSVGTAAPQQNTLPRPAAFNSLGACDTSREELNTRPLERFAQPPTTSSHDYDLLGGFASDLRFLLAVGVEPSPQREALGGQSSLAASPGLPAYPARRAPALDCDSRRRTAASVSPPSFPFSRRIPRYARLIAKHSESAGLDWRLVAALISEESSFEEGAVSPAGARGLMQLMPRAAAEVGVANISKPESNIRAGVLYLSRLSDRYPEARASDRSAFALASYMLGPGHVADARGLARDLGLDPHAWRRGLEEALPLLEDDRFNRRTRLGYAQGRRAVNYVNRILSRYKVYRRHLERYPEARAVIERDDGSSARTGLASARSRGLCSPGGLRCSPASGQAF